MGLLELYMGKVTQVRKKLVGSAVFLKSVCPSSLVTRLTRKTEYSHPRIMTHPTSKTGFVGLLRDSRVKGRRFE